MTVHVFKIQCIQHTHTHTHHYTTLPLHLFKIQCIQHTHTHTHIHTHTHTHIQQIKHFLPCVTRCNKWGWERMKNKLWFCCKRTILFRSTCWEQWDKAPPPTPTPPAPIPAYIASTLVNSIIVNSQSLGGWCLGCWALHTPVLATRTVSLLPKKDNNKKKSTGIWAQALFHLFH